MRFPLLSLIVFLVCRVPELVRTTTYGSDSEVESGRRRVDRFHQSEGSRLLRKGCGEVVVVALEAKGGTDKIMQAGVLTSGRQTGFKTR